MVGPSRELVSGTFPLGLMNTRSLVTQEQGPESSLGITPMWSFFFYFFKLEYTVV